MIDIDDCFKEAASLFRRMEATSDVTEDSSVLANLVVAAAIIQLSNTIQDAGNNQSK